MTLQTQTTETTTVLRRFQTPFIMSHPSLDPYGYTGDCSRLQGITKPLGDVEHSECMDPTTAGGFREDTEIVSRPGSVTSTAILKKSIAAAIQAEGWEDCRYNIDVRLQLENSGARNDVMNWNAIDRIIRAKFTERSTDDETVFTRDDEGEVLITMPFSAPPLAEYNIRRMSTKLIDTDKAGDILCIAHLQHATCPGITGPAVGCKSVVGTEDIGGSPYFGISIDGGQTWTWQAFDGTNNTPTWTNPITGIGGLGDLIIATSHDEGAHAVSTDGGTTWAEIVLTDYAAHPPNAVFVYSPTAIWIVGDDGYIWKSTDGGQTATTASGGDAGVITAENLMRVKGLSDLFVIAVGTNNAIVETTNGGQTWSLIAGPAAQAAVTVTSIAIWNQTIWALTYLDGELYWTDNGGDTWDEDEQITNLSATALLDVEVHDAERYVLVGEDADGDALIYENVNGAPGKWSAIAAPGDTQMLYGVITCDQNLWIAVGEVTYTGAEGAIVRIAG
jgi:photosystem II stability/assembly factor-like uncharacterized protein